MFTNAKLCRRRRRRHPAYEASAAASRLRNCCSRPAQTHKRQIAIGMQVSRLQQISRLDHPAPPSPVARLAPLCDAKLAICFVCLHVWAVCPRACPPARPPDCLSIYQRDCLSRAKASSALILCPAGGLLGPNQTWHTTKGNGTFIWRHKQPPVYLNQAQVWQRNPYSSAGLRASHQIGQQAS